jgi:hypothetical protein
VHVVWLTNAKFGEVLKNRCQEKFGWIGRIAVVLG